MLHSGREMLYIGEKNYVKKGPQRIFRAMMEFERGGGRGKRGRIRKWP